MIESTPGFSLDTDEKCSDENGQGDPPDDCWDSGYFREADFSELPDREDMLFDPREGEGIGDSSKEHSEEADECVDASGRDGSHGGSRAVAVECHADAKEGAAQDDSENVGVFEMVAFDPADGFHGKDTEAADDDGGEHDLKNGEVLEAEQVDDNIVVGDTTLVEEDAENEAEYGSGDEAR